MSDTMSGAELRVQLTGLGLTPVWLAERLNIATRTVIRWCTLDQVPAKAVAEIDRVAALRAAEMDRIYHGIQDSGVVWTYRTDKEAEGVAFCNTLPASWHRALAFQVLHYARSQGVNAKVAYQ